MKKLLVIFLLSIVEIAAAQKADIKVGLDTSDIKIGQQTGLNFKATVATDEFVLLPAPPDSLAFGLEVVNRSNVDSVVEGSLKTYRQKLTITSFDSGYHEGTKVKVIEQQNEWVRIKISDGNIGWLLAENIEII